jgi:hypothetical protein
MLRPIHDSRITSQCASSQPIVVNALIAPPGAPSYTKPIANLGITPRRVGIVSVRSTGNRKPCHGGGSFPSTRSGSKCGSVIVEGKSGVGWLSGTPFARIIAAKRPEEARWGIGCRSSSATTPPITDGEGARLGARPTPGHRVLPCARNNLAGCPPWMNPESPNRFRAGNPICSTLSHRRPPVSDR